jgi:signal transduction histidine kinase
VNSNLQTILDIIEQSDDLTSEKKEVIIKALKDADRELQIVSFKLDRTEKVKKTTGILLEETIQELELKRKDIEETNQALQSSLEELKATQAQLIQSEKMASLGELTAGIAHEIQNPLNFVNNFSEVSTEMIDELEEEIDLGDYEEVKAISKDLKQNLEKIHHHGKRAESIVKGMLLHSRTNKGEKILTDINGLCEEYLRLSYHGLRAKDKSFNAKFEMDLDKSIPKMEIIPQDIGRVLLNLFNNAFQAASSLGYSSASSNFENKNPKINTVISPQVSVKTKNIGDKIEITISDNGHGIPADIMDKIFQPFFTTKPTGQGTGLGLSLAYDIVKAHGGQIKVESKLGQGTKFIIYLPLS